MLADRGKAYAEQLCPARSKQIDSRVLRLDVGGREKLPDLISVSPGFSQVTVTATSEVRRTVIK
jgi:hypothetical protein